MRKRVFFPFLVIALIVPLSLSACAAPPEEVAPPAAPDTIKFGAAMAFSGWGAASCEMSHAYKNYTMWAENINAEGGIYVKDYDKKIPVELIIYDDKTDPATTVKMYEKLILDDKVDVTLAPWGTAWHFAVAPITNKYGYPLIGTTEASLELTMEAKYSLPYFFGVENQFPEMSVALTDLLVECGVKSAAVVFVGTLFGIDHVSALTPLLATAGIDVLLVKSYPVDILDFSPLLKDIKPLNPDALLSCSYANDSMLLLEQMMVIDFNPKFLYMALSAYPVIRDKFGAEAVEGIISKGGWNKDFPYAGVAEYYDTFVKRWGEEPSWVSAYVYAPLQIWEEVLANVGLDREKQRDYIATHTFPTVWGNAKFVDQFDVDTACVMSQWQNGVVQPLSPKEKREAMGVELIYPKPEWPK